MRSMKCYMHLWPGHCCWMLARRWVSAIELLSSGSKLKLKRGGEPKPQPPTPPICTNVVWPTLMLSIWYVCILWYYSCGRAANLMHGW